MASSSALPRGFTFSPPDADLISAYLRPNIARQTLPEHAAKFLHTADVYAADPATLVSAYLPAVLPSRKNGEHRRCWYFFGSAKAKSGRDPRRIRAVGGDKGGTWHSEKGRQVVFDGDVPVGYKQNFSFKPSNADGSAAPAWLMVEFGVNDLGGDETGEAPVLWKVYQSPRKPRSASISTTTPAPAYKGERKRKRKARDDDDSSPVTTTSCTRRRLFVPNPPAAPILPELPGLNGEYLDDVSLDQLLQHLMADQGLLGDYLPMPFSESDSNNCSFSMADQAGSMATNYNTIIPADSSMPFLQNSYPSDFLMPVFEPQSFAELQDQTTVLSCSSLPCTPYAGFSGSWTGGDTTDDEAPSMMWYGSAPSSPASPAQWMMQSYGSAPSSPAIPADWMMQSYGSAPSSPAIPADWMMQSAFATTYQF